MRRWAAFQHDSLRSPPRSTLICVSQSSLGINNGATFFFIRAQWDALNHQCFAGAGQMFACVQSGAYMTCSSHQAHVVFLKYECV